VADVIVADRTVAVEFSADAGPLLAGGPVSLEVVISLRDGEPADLIASASRATGRSPEYAFTGTLPGGATLRDPYAGAVEIGGVQTAQSLTAQAPVVQHVLLNQFLTLEDVLDHLADGDSIELVLQAGREIRFEGSPDGEAVRAEASLTLTLRRDDAALAARYRKAAEAVMAARQFDVRREQLVVELCTARNSLAVDALTTLTHHPDGSVAARAQQALDVL
jgi:hypothetical protein